MPRWREGPSHERHKKEAPLVRITYAAIISNTYSLLSSSVIMIGDGMTDLQASPPAVSITMMHMYTGMRK